MTRTGINLIVAFAIALKHKLRFEPDVAYEDLAGLVCHLDTFARAAHDSDLAPSPKPGKLKAVGSYLSLPFAVSNPRKAIKRSKKPLGNLPLEILMHLATYVDHIGNNGSTKLAVYQSQAGM
jgi:ion channel-forming bestrophin family protein